MMFGLDLVSVHPKNLTVNSLPVPNGEALFQNGYFFKAELLSLCFKFTF